jgi:hypothetical protein
MIKVIDTVGQEVDIDDCLVVKKKKPKKKKVSYTTYFNWQVRQLDAELEHKLPNEFRGSIDNFNHRSCGGMGQIDDNQYY